MKIMNKIIIVLLLLLMLTVISTIASADIYQTTCPIIEDGYFDNNNVKINDSVYTKTRDTGSPGWCEYVSYFIFDLSSVPLSANVTDISLNFEIRSTQGSTSWRKFYTIESWPAVTKADCGNGHTLHYYTWHFYHAGIKNINTTKTEGGGSGFQSNSYATLSVEDNLSRGWWGYGFNMNSACDGCNSLMYTWANESTHLSPYLWIEYELNAPIFNNSLTQPINNAEGVNLSTQLSVNLTHTAGNGMFLNWSWWNALTSTWDLFDRDGGVSNDFDKKKLITIDHTKVDATLTNFPVWVYDVNDTWKTSVTSFSFYDTGGTELNWELEYFDVGTGTIGCWVNVTSISSTADTNFYIYYDEAASADGGEHNPTDVWDSNYVGVWHMDNAYDTNKVNDSTSYGQEGTKTSGTPTQATGKFGYGQDFEATDTHYIDFGDHAQYHFDDIASYEVWVNFEATVANYGILDKGNNMADKSFCLQLTVLRYFRSALRESDATDVHSIGVNGSIESTVVNSEYCSATTRPLDGGGGWYSIYSNISNCTDLGNTVWPFMVGASSDTSGNIQYYMDGVIDEVRLSDIERSAAWVDATYNSQNSPSTFLTFGSAQDSSGLTYNGTYTSWFHNATELCTTYYWQVEATDIYGNTTIEIYTFKTHCVTPPSGTSCSKNSTTSLNLSFTPLPDYNGTTYTYIRYNHGAFPPTSIDSGTFGGNTTNASFVIEGLDQGQCYAFSLWTVWKNSTGWFTSSSHATKGCCVAGGDYWIFFFNEESQQPWNLSMSPGNYTVHKLLIHYWDSTEDAFYIGEPDNGECLSEAYDPAAWCDIINEDGFCFINVSATQEVWYFELIWNYASNISRLQSGQHTFPTYTRKLTPEISRNVSITFSWGTEYRESIWFFMANRTVYGSTYTSYDGTYYNTTTDSTFENSIVKYEYLFYDETSYYVKAQPNDAFISIYIKNLTGGFYYIHQEYLDAALGINPPLIFERDYLMGANCSEHNITNFGIAPTEINQNPLIYIREELTGEQVIKQNATLSWEWVDGDLEITYDDARFLTQEVWLRVYENTTDGTAVFSESVSSCHYTFDFDTAKQNANITYVALVIFNMSDIVAGKTFYGRFTLLRVITYFLFEPLDTITNINTIIATMLGPSLIPSVGWASLMVAIFSLIIMLAAFALINPIAGFLAGGMTMLFINFLIEGFGTIVSNVGVLLCVLGFIILFNEYRVRRSSV